MKQAASIKSFNQVKGETVALEARAHLTFTDSLMFSGDSSFHNLGELSSSMNRIGSITIQSSNFVNNYKTGIINNVDFRKY